jgi:predicted phosphodiesterase
VSLLRDFEVGAVISGHNHSSTTAPDRTLRVVSSGSVGKPFGGAKSGLAVVSVTPNGVEHRFYDFGALPSRIEIR